MYYLPNICSLCLARNENLKNISSEDTDGIVVEEKLKVFLLELVNFKPDIPKNVCENCLENLNYIYKFRIKCLENITILNEYLKKFTIDGSYKQISVDHTDIKSEKDHQIDTETNVGTYDSYFLIENIVVKSELDEDESEKSNFNKEQNETLLAKNNVSEKESDEKLETKSSHLSFIDLQKSILADNVTVKSEKSHALNHSQTLCERFEEFNKEMHIEDNKINIVTSTVFENIEIRNQNINGEEQYKCKDCNAVFEYSSILKKHKQIHTASRPYKCPTCHKTFQLLNHLKTHKRTHTGEKPFTCDVCYKTFSNVGNLQKHQRIHTNERPYQCTLCDKSFKQSIHLIHHKLTHTGEKPYHCQLCEFKCSIDCSLKRHMRTHSSDNQYNIPALPGPTTCVEPPQVNLEKEYQAEPEHENSDETSVGTSDSYLPSESIVLKNELVDDETCKNNQLNLVKDGVYQHVQENLDVNITETALNRSQSLCESFAEFKEQTQIEHDNNANTTSTNITTSINNENHKRAHEKPFTCNVCYKAFNNPSNLQKHQRIHTNERPYKCSFCDKAFTQSITLTHHQRTHTGEKPFHCQLCQYKTARESSLKRHMVRVHSSGKPQQYNVSSQLDYTATCDSYFPSENMNSNSYFTEEQNQMNLQAHDVDKETEENFETENSNVSFDEHVQENFLEVNITVKEEHENALNNITTSTITTSTNRENSNEVKETVSSETQEFNPVFQQSKQKLNHSEDRTHKCTICHKGFQRASHLKTHALTHSGDKPYTCGECHRTFGNVSNFQKHQRTHVNERPYHCSFCDKTFAQSINLIHHQRTHTGEKPFHCQLCEYKTARESSLKRHMLTHTGEKPYQCSICQHKCIQLCHFKEHMLIHTTKKPDTFILGV